MDEQRYFFKYEDRSDIPAENYGKKKKTPTIWVVLLCVLGVSAFSFASGFIGVCIGKAISEKNGEEQTTIVYESSGKTQVPLEDADGNKTVAGVASAVKENIVDVVTETYLSTPFRDYCVSYTGSGIVWAQGLIVTNEAALTNVKSVKVVFSDGTERVATIYGKDAETGIAILKVSSGGCDGGSVIVGNSSVLKTGQKVVAAGGSQKFSVSEGIVNTPVREVSVNSRVMELIETSAAICPAYSGGGLFDMEGNLVGVINAKNGCESEGACYAVPVDTVKKVVEDIISVGYVRGRVDTEFIRLDEVLNTSVLMPRIGVRVSEIIDEECPFVKGDYILYVGADEITTRLEWANALAKKDVGDTISVTLIRNGVTMELQYILKEKVKR